MNKAELVQAMAERAGLSKSDAEKKEKDYGYNGENSG